MYPRGLATRDVALLSSRRWQALKLRRQPMRPVIAFTIEFWDDEDELRTLTLFGRDVLEAFRSVKWMTGYWFNRVTRFRERDGPWIPLIHPLEEEEPLPPDPNQLSLDLVV